jgi:hypothetical protein
MKSLLHVVCDYAPGDMAWAEVMSAVHAQITNNWSTHQTSVGSFDTISTGFVVAQLALADSTLRPEQLVIFANCAPRKDLTKARTNNEGEGLLYALLNNGVRVLIVNSGYSMSFLKNDIQKLWSVHVDAGGSQFRSRDNFPRVLGQLVADDSSFLWHELTASEHIPEAPVDAIAYIDSFGNQKTTIRDGDPRLKALSPGQRIKVIINGVTRTATVATGSFSVMEGDLAFAPGSSGHARRYWEFFQRGGSASAEFDRPHVGEQIQLILE